MLRLINKSIKKLTRIYKYDNIIKQSNIVFTHLNINNEIFSLLYSQGDLTNCLINITNEISRKQTNISKIGVN